jgi:hypothetical protein
MFTEEHLYVPLKVRSFLDVRLVDVQLIADVDRFAAFSESVYGWADLA